MVLQAADGYSHLHDARQYTEPARLLLERSDGRETGRTRCIPGSLPGRGWWLEPPPGGIRAAPSRHRKTMGYRRPSGAGAGASHHHQRGNWWGALLCRNDLGIMSSEEVSVPEKIRWCGHIKNSTLRHKEIVNPDEARSSRAWVYVLIKSWCARAAICPRL